MNEQEKKDYYEFLKNNKRCHFLQSTEWAQVKDSWKNEIITIRDKDGNIEAGMSILIRKIGFLGSIMYAPRGPICDITNKEVINKLIEKIKEIAKREKAFIFRWDPDVPDTDEEFKKIVTEAGIKLKENINHDINKVLQPKYEMQLTLKDKNEEELLKSFNQKTRYNIRLAGRKGVTVEEGNENDIEEFFEILSTTSQRDQFTIRNVNYYKKVYNNMKENGHAKLYFAKYEGKRIAATLEIIYGNKAWYLYGASLREHSNVMPNYLLQWKMMKHAKECGCEYYNFGGVSGYIDEKASGYGVYKFKKGFNPDFIEYVNELNIIFKPFNNMLFNLADKIRHIAQGKN